MGLVVNGLVNGQWSMVNRQWDGFYIIVPQFTIHHSPFTIHNSQFTIHHSPFKLGASIMQETQLIKIDGPRACCEIHKILRK
jgi:hypothetical protein